MLHHASFYSTKSARDAAYAHMKDIISGTDHGVSGGDTNPFTGTKSEWQLWVTQESGDAKAFDSAAVGATKSVTEVD